MVLLHEEQGTEGYTCWTHINGEFAIMVQKLWPFAALLGF